MKNKIVFFLLPLLFILFSCNNDDNNNSTEELSLNDENIFTLKGVSYSLDLWVATGGELFVGICIERQDETPFQLSDLILEEVEVYTLGNNDSTRIVQIDSTSKFECSDFGFCQLAFGVQADFEDIESPNEIGLIIHFTNGSNENFIDTKTIVNIGVPTSWGSTCINNF